MTGDSTPGNEARIIAILRDRIIVSYRGRNEAILLADDPTAKTAGALAPRLIHHSARFASSRKIFLITSIFPRSWSINSSADIGLIPAKTPRFSVNLVYMKTIWRSL